MKLTWQACGDVENDPWASLMLLLSSYAFERQGRSPDYSHAAVDTIEQLRLRPLTQNSNQEAWCIFSEKLNNTALNHVNNPLCPRGTRCFRNYRGNRREATVQNKSIIELLTDNLGNQSLIKWAKDQINDNRIADAHTILCQVNGISNKIASFFLRDVACNYALTPRQNRPLLQPIDVWIRFVVHELSGEQLNDTNCANYIVNESQEPERINQGIWYFCAEVVKSSRYMVACSLADVRRFDSLVDRHILGLQNDAEVALRFREET